MEKLFNRMSGITRRYLKNFKKDFEYDKERLEESEERFFVWLVRENGTHLCSKKDVTGYGAYDYFIDNPEVRYYEIDKENETVVPIKDRKEYLEICELLKLTDSLAV